MPTSSCTSSCRPAGRRTAISSRVLPGSDAKLKPLLLLAHIDVVEANRADWERDPFKLVEEDGFFYARGASDDKAMAAVFADSHGALQEGEVSAEAHHQAGADLRRRNAEHLQRRELPHREPPRSHRRRLRAQRRRRRALRPEDRRVSLRRGAGVREGLPGLHADHAQPGRALLAPHARQRDLSARACARQGRSAPVQGRVQRHLARLLREVRRRSRAARKAPT